MVRTSPLHGEGPRFESWSAHLFTSPPQLSFEELSTLRLTAAQMPNFRYISWSEYGNLAAALAEKIRAKGKHYDLVVGIARGGIPVAMAVSDHINVKIDFVNVKSYSDYGKRTQPRILSTLTEDIGGKDILLVDDLVDQGDTLASMKKYLGDQKPRAIDSAVMFKKPWSKEEPDYYLETVTEWIVFPFELGEAGRKRAEMETGAKEPASEA
jgi:uncharacterized protein